MHSCGMDRGEVGAAAAAAAAAAVAAFEGLPRFLAPVLAGVATF